MKRKKPVIAYPPVSTRKWIPPYARPKAQREPKYVKPDGVHQRLKPNTLARIWHQFDSCGDRGILFGHFSETHKRFRPRSNGYQTACNCVTAIAFSKIYGMAMWNRFVLDRILELGDRLYLTSHQKLKDRSKPCVSLEHVFNWFFIWDAKVTVATKGNKRTGKLFPDFEDSQYLDQVVVEFFEAEDSGVLVSQDQTLALWRSDDAFYAFYSTDHDKRGRPWKGIPGEGFSCVLRFPTIQALVGGITANFDRRNNDKFTLTPCGVARMSKVNTIPPERIEDLRPLVRITKSKSALEKTPVPVAELEEPDAEPSVVLTAEEEAGQREADEFAPGIETAVPRKEVSKGHVPIERPRVESVTYFQGLVPSKMGILRATTHQTDPRTTTFAGNQRLANALASLAMLRRWKSRVWVPRILDQILRTGNRLYADAMRDLEPGRELRLRDIKRIRVEETDYEPEVDEFSAVGRLQSEEPDVLDLPEALREFFSDREACVINGPLVVSAWYEEGYYYMFDANERDSQGGAVRDPGQPGVACVTWFKNLKDLVELYSRNVPKDARREVFVVSGVEMHPYSETPDSWNDFKGLEEGRWILRGTISQNDRRFPLETRNTQCTPVAAVALAMAKIRNPKTWTRDTIDHIVLEGDSLHSSCVASLQARGDFHDPKLTVDELDRTFVLSGKRVNLDVSDCLVNGLMDAKRDRNVLDLNAGLVKFFEDNEFGIVTSKQVSVAVWKNHDGYYCFDSHELDDRGLKSGFGTACALRFADIAGLSKAIEANLGPDKTAAFNIGRIDLEVLDIDDEGVVRPPLNHYAEIDGSKSILRSIHSVHSDRFDINVGKQTVPTCLVALGMKYIYPSAVWSQDVADEVVVRGDELYERSMERDKDIREVDSDNVVRDFSIGVNKFELEYKSSQEGTFEGNLEDALKSFLLDDSENGFLLESELLTLSGWKEDGLYYLFDPKPRDAFGQVIGKDDWSAKHIPPPPPPPLEEDAEAEQELKPPEAEQEIKPPEPEPELEHKLSQVPEPDSEFDIATKRSSSYWHELEKDGRGCVIRFTTVGGLVEHIIENMPPNKRDLPYRLISVDVANRAELKETFEGEGERETNYDGDWYNFREIDKGRWALQGTINQLDAMFPVENRGKQGVANCYVALGHALLYAASKLKPQTVDSVLKYGDRLYTATQRAHSDDVLRKFCIGADQVAIDVQSDVVKGDINAQDFEDIYDVKRGLESFFANHKYGMLESKDSTVAVWKGEKVFYMFDPQPRGPSGLKTSFGRGVITRFLEIEKLAEVFVKTLPRIGRNDFLIHGVEVDKVPCPRPPKPEEKVRPEEPRITGFVQLSPGKCILRGAISQEDPKFGRGRNVQCAPIAIMALSMTLVHKTDQWTKPIVEEIVTLGDELYVASLDSLGFAFNPWEQGMSAELVNKDYKVGVLRANCELRNADQRGIIDIKHPKITNLRAGIQKFFEENTHGIIQTEALTVAIWEEQDRPGIIYMLDPNPCGPAGQHQNDGTACVLSFESPELAAKHFIANLPQAKRTGEYVITPVEIVVGKRRNVCGIRRKRRKVGAGCLSDPNLWKPPPSPTARERRRIRQMDEEERNRKSLLREEKLRRESYHPISRGVAILRATHSQGHTQYSPASRGNQDIPNCLVAFVVHCLVPILTWTHKHLDLILSVGDQVYKDSYITYSPDHPKLGLKNVLRTFFIKDVRVSLAIYKPAISDALQALGLEMALLNYFTQDNFCVLEADGSWYAVFFKSGCYYLFDPHDCDLDGKRTPEGCQGCACVLRYDDLESLADRVAANAIGSARFSLTLVAVTDIVKLTGCVGT